mmetsp:Transcript_126092/g.218507  ORF Transcript_126092/g.218507 Transcript_126092/m.218507 type:complete len:141 (-) Transcript_126092:76-498(-)
MPFGRLLLLSACAVRLADLEALCVLRGSGEELLAERRAGTVEEPASAPAPSTGESPTKVDYSKKIRALPEHGYDEHSDREVHYDSHSHAADWMKEWPQNNQTEVESIKRICQENPANDWCKRYPFPGKKEESMWDKVGMR